MTSRSFWQIYRHPGDWLHWIVSAVFDQESFIIEFGDLKVITSAFKSTVRQTGSVSLAQMCLPAKIMESRIRMCKFVCWSKKASMKRSVLSLRDRWKMSYFSCRPWRLSKKSFEVEKNKLFISNYILFQIMSLMIRINLMKNKMKKSQSCKIHDNLFVFQRHVIKLHIETSRSISSDVFFVFFLSEIQKDELEISSHFQQTQWHYFPSLHMIRNIFEICDHFHVFEWVSISIFLIFFLMSNEISHWFISLDILFVTNDKEIYFHSYFVTSIFS